VRNVNRVKHGSEVIVAAARPAALLQNCSDASTP
jgi:hypothetical protein